MQVGKLVHEIVERCELAVPGIAQDLIEPVFLGGSKGTSRGAIGLVRDAPGIPFRENWGSPHSGGVQFLYGDGSVRTLAYGADMALLAALLTPDGGEAVPAP